MTLNILLVSTYELGRQPFGLASPAAWLHEVDATVQCLDLSVQCITPEQVQQADMIGFYLSMHMATRMALPLIQKVRALKPDVHICCFGLYAPVNAAYLRDMGVDTILGGEFEAGLLQVAQRLARGENGSQSEPLISLAKQNFRLPDRSTLAPLDHYAHLKTATGQAVQVGYTEASRGCKHVCRHCPIVPVYNGRFRIVSPEVVLADIRQQVEAGARHITFGDPDFFNGPGHALPLVEAFHTEFPDLTYDVTIKVEHLWQQREHLATLKETGCLFITTAVESFDDNILDIFDKRHTTAEFETVLNECRKLNLTVVPTFVAFSPWTTLDGYRHFLAEIARLDLVAHVAPVQYTLRLLVPPGSKLLELPETQHLIGPLDRAKLTYTWRNADPRVDALQQDLDKLADETQRQGLSRQEIFTHIWERAYQSEMPPPGLSATGAIIPHMTEPWYC